ncbi:MAG: ABC transporter ATP-binding protein [Eubacteriales bacterium]
MLQLEKVSYTYDTGKKALENISLSLEKGEKVVLLGNNGAGKSTLFLLLNGVLTTEEGGLRFKDAPVGHREKDLLPLRKAVGLVFQDADAQLLGATVEQEISFGPMNLRLPKEAVQTAVDQAIAAMDLAEMRNRSPQYLSGGEKKRVSIADILAMEPEMILFDEPTASLDPAHTQLFAENLADLHQKGLGLLISTHDVGFAWQWADRAIVLAQGALIADGKIGDIFADNDLLRRACLKKPVLFELAETLFPGANPNDLPRTTGEFHQLLQR